MAAAVLGAGVALAVTRDTDDAPGSEQLAAGEVRPGRDNVVESTDGMVNVTIPGDSITEPGTLTIEPVTGRKGRDGWSIDLADAELVGPATIRFTGLDLEAGEPPPLVTSSQQPDGKARVARNVTLDGDTVVVTTRHFSNWFLDPWSDLVGTVTSWLVVRMDETASISGDRAPRCDGEQQARDDGYEPSSDSGRRVYWCLGWENDSAVLKVVNARRYGVLSEHTPGLDITAREQGGLVDRFAELFTPGSRQPGNHTALLAKGNEVEFTLDPTDPLVGVRLSPDPGGYLLTALQFAVETLDMAFKTAGVADTAAKIVDALAEASCLTTLSDLATSGLSTQQAAQDFFITALDMAFACVQVAGAQIDVGPVNKFLVEPVLWLYNGISLALAGAVALTDLFIDLFTSSDGYRIQVSHEVAPTITQQTASNLLIPARTCGVQDGTGWDQPKPIQLRGGYGETFDSSYRGAGILATTLVGAVDVTGDGADEAVVAVRCTGSRRKDCCAGRTSALDFVVVLDLTGPVPRRVGNTIMPTSVPAPNGYDEFRSFVRSEVTLDGTTVVTYQRLVYGDSLSESQRDRLEGEVRYAFQGGRWVPTNG